MLVPLVGKDVEEGRDLFVGDSFLIISTKEEIWNSFCHGFLVFESLF